MVIGGMILHCTVDEQGVLAVADSSVLTTCPVSVLSCFQCLVRVLKMAQELAHIVLI